MGTYKFTFQDGSQAICHYGVLGMKWGKRKDGLPQGYSNGRQRVNSVLSPRAKKIAKGIAIGAGVAAAAYGAHRLGLDKAALDFIASNRKPGVIDVNPINAVREHRAKSPIQRYVSNQKHIIRTSSNLGGKSIQKVGSINRNIATRASSNAKGVPGFVQNQLGKAKSSGSALYGPQARSAKQQAAKAAASRVKANGQSAVQQVLHSPTSSVQTPLRDIYINGASANARGAAAARSGIADAANSYLNAAGKRKKRRFF